MANIIDKPVPPEEPDELTDIVNQFSYIKKPPPPPIKMLVSEYIEFLNFLKSNQAEQRKVLEALKEYNQVCENAVNNLTKKLREIYLGR